MDSNHYLFTVIFIVSLIIGSFLGLASFRIPIILKKLYNEENEFNNYKKRTYNLAIPRSQCPNCLNTISFHQNIPLISYIFLFGKCSYCKKSISPRYPIIEITTLIVFIFIFYNSGINLSTLPVYALACLLIVASVIDLEHGLLPNVITIPILVLGLTVNALEMNSIKIYSSIIGAIFGYYSLWIIYKIHKFFTKKDGMGYGDFKLMAAIGSWTGWQMIPLIIFFSSLFGIIFSLFPSNFKKYSVRTSIPFGPFIAITGFIAFLYREELLLFYILYL